MSFLIPCYSPKRGIRQTLDLVLEVTSRLQIKDFEIVLVCDSPLEDDFRYIQESVQQRALSTKSKLVQNLRNLGQHRSLIVGLGECQKDVVFTMDEECVIESQEVCEFLTLGDLEPNYVHIADLRQKGRSLFREWISLALGFYTSAVFGIRPLRRYSSYRLIPAALSRKIARSRIVNPYVTAECLLRGTLSRNKFIMYENSKSPSTYRARQLLRLARTVLFTYSTYPLKVLIRLLLLTASLACLASIITVSSYRGGSTPEGWATLSFVGSLVLLIVSSTLALWARYFLVDYQARYLA